MTEEDGIFVTDYIYGNTPCFLGGKKVQIGTNEVNDRDVLIYGVPWEGAVTWETTQEQNSVQNPFV